jgi:hypothetical protein
MLHTKKILNRIEIIYHILLLFLIYLTEIGAQIIDTDNIDRGYSLFLGLKDIVPINFTMPLMSLYSFIIDYLDIYGIMFKIILFFNCLLVYNITRKITNKIPAIFSSFGIYLLFTQNNNIKPLSFENLLYSLALLTMVDLYINKLKRYNLINSILAGISISITFLIKSPLFLMPFFSLIFDYLYIKTDKKNLY